MVFAAPGHPLADGRALADAQLLRLPWIVREPGSGTARPSIAPCTACCRNWTSPWSYQHTEAIKRAVGSGTGGRLPVAHQPRRRLRAAAPWCRWTPGRDFSRELYLLTHRDKYHGAALQRWLELCRRAQ